MRTGSFQYNVYTGNAKGWVEATMIGSVAYATKKNNGSCEKVTLYVDPIYFIYLANVLN